MYNFHTELFTTTNFLKKVYLTIHTETQHTEKPLYKQVGNIFFSFYIFSCLFTLDLNVETFKFVTLD